MLDNVIAGAGVLLFWVVYLVALRAWLRRADGKGGEGMRVKGEWW